MCAGGSGEFKGENEVWRKRLPDINCVPLTDQVLLRILSHFGFRTVLKGGCTVAPFYI